MRPGSEQPLESRAVRQFLRKVPAERWYQTLRKLGLQYGPRFQMLKDISADPVGYAAAASLREEHESSESIYALHPTVIDQSLQLLGVVACSGVPRRVNKLAVPASIEQLYVAKGGSQISLEATASDAASGIWCGDAIATANNELVLSMSRATFFFLEEDDDSNGPTVPLATRIEWKPDIDFVPATNLLPSTPPKEAGMDSLAKLTVLQIIGTAYKLQSVDPTSPHLAKYKNWVNAKAAEIRENKQPLVPEAQDWAALDLPIRLKIMSNLEEEIMKSGPDIAGIFERSRIVFRRCTDIMEGKVSPLELLMEDRGLEKFYNVASSWSDWSLLLPLLGHSNPSLKVLEIGAGTGGSTAVALNHLHPPGSTRMYSSYTFTDITPGFLTAAEERFKDKENVDYAVLDISRDPLEQGFKAGSYDLIIASNVSLL